jgi:hypothetical protein
MPDEEVKKCCECGNPFTADKAHPHMCTDCEEKLNEALNEDLQ